MKSILAGFVLAFLLPAHAQEAVPALDPQAVPEKEWQLPKDSAEYAIGNDEWFAAIGKLAASKPTYAPGTGIGDGGGGEFATLLVKPTDPGAARQKWFEVGMSYSVTGWDREGKAIHSLTRFALVGYTREADQVRERFLGQYQSEVWLQRFIGEVLRQSQAIHKRLAPKLADGRWAVEGTAAKERYLIDEELLGELEAAAGQPLASGQEQDPTPWASVLVCRTMDTAMATRSSGRDFRALVYRDGRLKISSRTQDKDKVVYQDLGWVKNPVLWNKIRLRIVSPGGAREGK